jgi:mandelate racemase
VSAVAESRLTIRGLRVRTVEVPMPHPHRTAGGTITSSPLVLTDLLTDEGPVGSSYVFCYTALALRPTALLLQGLEPVLAGQPVAPLELDRQLAARFRLLGAQGLAGIALSAIDMAAWDALARAHDLPLVRLLGAEPRPVRMYGSVGYDGVDGSAREAGAWAERGVTGVKAKIGYPDVLEDLAVIRAIRRAAGDEMAVMVDYNQSLTPVEAVERARRLDDEGLTWIEEPTRAEDYAGMAEVARAASTPIQAGENWWGPQELAKAIAAGASD